MKKPKTKKIPTATVQLPPRKAARIARRLARAIALGKRIGQLCERKRELLLSAHAAGLPLNEPIAIPELDGDLYRLQKPAGKFVHFDDIELKSVPKFSRTPIEGDGSQLSTQDSQPPEDSAS